MGCGSSKLDDLPAVGLCRERCAFLDEAIHQRYAFAEAHVAYMHSLKVVGESLRRFFDQDLHSSAGRPPSPVLNLPSKRKGDPEPSGHPKPAIHHSDSSSDSHLHFDSDEEDSGSESLHHHLDAGSPVHPYGQMNYVDEETLGSYPGGGGGGGGGFMHMNYMQNRATPSVSYQQRPISTETVQMGESSSFNPYPYANQNVNNPYGYYNYSNYGGYFASSPPRQYGYSAPAAPQAMSSSVASSSKPPPPPPSPPRASAWDFLNPFGNTDNHYAPYTPSRDSREVREEEGIPDLEEEDYEDVKEVLGLVKEVRGHQKFVDSGGGGGGKYSPEMASDEAKGNDSESLYRGKPAPPSMENNPLEYEVHMVDKKVVNKEEISGDRSNGAGSKALGDTEIVRQIEGEFVRASESGNDNELVKMLEVGKLPHNRKHAAYQASKMLNMISPSLTVVASKNETADPALLDVDEGLGLKSTTLSSTLRKLFLWEKKLYEEVKVEEKMRILHEKKCRKLKRMDERGAEAHKVESTRTLVRSLSTKIRISIQVVDKISVKINKLRDEELWPQLNEFIQGLTRMWKSMLESHRTQCRAITEAKHLDSISSHKHLSDAHLESTIQLEHELLNWALRFSCWAGAQKGFVRALNNWLLKSLLYVPEETPDGIIPFSPSRIGAPPVFGICNQWSQSLDQISEHEVVGSMRSLAATVMEVWERHKLETRQRTMAAAGDGKDGERRVRNLEREDQKVQREIQALDKMIVVSLDRERGGGLALGQAVYQSETSKNGSLQTSLQQVFEAVERFTANNVKAYEDLLQRIEEDNNRAPQES